MFNGLASDTGSLGKTFGTAATAWGNAVASAVLYEQNNATDVTLARAATVVATAASAPSTFTLTNANNPTTGGVDNIVGTAGNDKINGILDVTAGQPNGSFEASDIIDGGDGTDSLNLTVIGAAGGAPVAGVVTNIETINLNNASSAAAPSYAMDNVTGATTVNLTGSLDNTTLTLTGLQKIVDIGAAGQGGLTMTYGAVATVGAADVQKIALNGTSEGTNKTNIITVNGVETLAVTGNKDSKVTLTGNAVKAVTVAGAAATNITENDATLKTVDASAATGKTTIIIGTVPSVTSVKGGTADDTIAITGSITKDIAVDGGTGNNTLSVGNTTFTNDAFANVKNIQTILIAPASAYNAPTTVNVDVKNIAGLNNVATAETQTAAAVTSAETAVGDLLTKETELVTFTGLVKTDTISIDGYVYTAAGTLNAAATTTAFIAGYNAAGGTAWTAVPVTGSTSTALFVAKTAGNIADLADTGTTGANTPATVAVKFQGDALPADIVDFQENGSSGAYATLVNKANSGSTTFSSVASGSSVTISSANEKAIFSADPTKFDLLGQGAVTVNVLNATSAASTTDSLTINVANDNLSAVKNSALGTVSSAKNLNVIDSITVPGVESLTINSTGAFGGNTITTLTDTSVTSIVLTGSAALTFGATSTNGLAVSSTDTVTFDASALTGKLGLTIDATNVGYFSKGLVGGAGSSDSLTVLGSGVGDALTVKTTGFESVTFKPKANSTGSIDLSNLSGVKTETIKFSISTSVTDNITVLGITDGQTIGLQGTLGADGVTFQGAGSSSSLKLAVNEDATSAFAVGALVASRVGNLTLDVTRVDGTDSNTTVTQQNTQLTSLTGAALKTLTVVGPSDSGTLTLGDINNGVVSLLNTIDLTGFQGATASLTLTNEAASSKAITILPYKGTTFGVLAVASAAVATVGIALGSNQSETIKFQASESGTVVLGNFTGAAGATLTTSVDVLDFSALGIKQSDLTLTDVVATGTVHNLLITSNLFTGSIELAGVQSSALTSANFVF